MLCSAMQVNLLKKACTCFGQFDVSDPRVALNNTQLSGLKVESYGTGTQVR